MPFRMLDNKAKYVLQERTIKVSSTHLLLKKQYEQVSDELLNGTEKNTDYLDTPIIKVF